MLRHDGYCSYFYCYRNKLSNPSHFHRDVADTHEPPSWRPMFHTDSLANYLLASYSSALLHYSFHYYGVSKMHLPCEGPEKTHVSPYLLQASLNQRCKISNALHFTPREYYWTRNPNDVHTRDCCLRLGLSYPYFTDDQSSNESYEMR